MLKSFLPPALRGGTIQDKSDAGIVVRLASPNERRCIVREDLGFYRSLLVAGIYKFDRQLINSSSVHAYAAALRQCVQVHPALSTIVERADTEAPVYVQVPSVDLRNHIEILACKKASTPEDELKHIKFALPAIHDTKWSVGRPPWKIVILPFEENHTNPTTESGRVFIAFSFSHSLGDGISGLAFHRTLLIALQSNADGLHDDTDLTVVSPSYPTFEAFETPERLPISWSFMLSPFLATYLPKFISSYFGLRAAASSITPGTWTATPVFYNGENHRTAVEILRIEALTLATALMTCRRRDTKLTAFIHQSIVKALSQSLPGSPNLDNFVSQTAVNLRNAAGVSDDEMGLFVSGYYDIHPLHTDTESMWTFARAMSAKLATFARTLQDQPIGLLRFLPSVRSWTISKPGHERDSSYEISNLLAFEPASPKSRNPAQVQDVCHIEEMVFSQPANAVGAPIVFNVVSVKGGSLVCVVSWQIGAISAVKDDEQEFVARVCRSINASFHEIAEIET